MIKVEIRCHCCDASVAKELRYTDSIPYWGWRLWKSALAEGWARRRDDNIPFCSNCKSQLAAPSTAVLPIDPLPIIGYLECSSCSSRYEKGDVSVDEHFARKLREQARLHGWRLISSDGNKTYQDYCPDCEPDERTKQRLELMRLVWSKPTVKVAKEIEVSDKAIDKRCKRLEIPKPPPGFWRKYRTGYIRDCLAMMPKTVKDALGDDFIQEFYRQE